MVLKLGMQHQELKLYKVYINDDCVEIGETVTKSFNEENLQQFNNCVYEKQYPRGLSAPAPGLNITCI